MLLSRAFWLTARWSVYTGSAEAAVWGDPGWGYTAAEERSDPTAIGAGSNRSGSPYCPDPQQRPHGLASGHRVQPTQPDRNADRSLEERDRTQAQISQLLQANHGDPGRPESSEHNDRTRAACVRTHRLTLPLGKGRIPSPPRSMQQRYSRGWPVLIGGWVLLSRIDTCRQGALSGNLLVT